MNHQDTQPQLQDLSINILTVFSGHFLTETLASSLAAVTVPIAYNRKVSAHITHSMDISVKKKKKKAKLIDH